MSATVPDCHNIILKPKAYAEVKLKSTLQVGTNIASLGDIVK